MLHETVSQVKPDANGLTSTAVYKEANQLILACQLEVSPKPGTRLVLVLDNASWYKVKSLNWHHIEPMYLPPYSPDLNPI